MELLQRRYQQTSFVQGVLLRARRPPPPLPSGATEPACAYCRWTQLCARGTPPPPHKHPAMLVYECDRVTRHKGLAVTLTVRTLEVWCRAFTDRYNLCLAILDPATGRPADPGAAGTLSEAPMVWAHARALDPHHAPAARDAPSLCYYGGDGADTGPSLLLFGGKSAGGDYKTYYNDLWRFDYPANRWHRLVEGKGRPAARESAEAAADDGGAFGRAPGPRSSALAVVHGGALYVGGGMTRAGRRRDVHRLDLRANRWTELRHADPSKPFPSADEIGWRGAPAKGFSSRGLVAGSRCGAAARTSARSAGGACSRANRGDWLRAAARNDSGRWATRTLRGRCARVAETKRKGPRGGPDPFGTPPPQRRAPRILAAAGLAIKSDVECR